MSTRAATAAMSQRAKQEVVRLLFGPSFARKGPEAHRKLDSHSYSYLDLRKAYLERLHSIHPDKFAHHDSNEENEAPTHETVPKGDLHSRFVELQDAWDRYEQVAKQLKNVTKGDKQDANFTLFGVGCSFSDSPEERALRSAITDQACRGWFSSGAIADISNVQNDEYTANESMEDRHVSLVDDDLFQSVEDIESHSHDDNLDGQPAHRQRGRRPCLVAHAFKPRY